MTLWQIAAVAVAGAISGAGVLILITFGVLKIEKWHAARGGRFPWEKD